MPREVDALELRIGANAGELVREVGRAERAQGRFERGTRGLAQAQIRQARAARAYQQAIGRLGRSFNQLLSPARAFRVAITALAGGGGLGLAVRNAAQFGDEIAKSADSVGLSIEAFQELRFAIERSGGTIQTFNTGLRTFTTNLGLAAGGTGTLYSQLRSLGEEELLNNLLDAGDTERAIEILLARLSEIEDSQQRLAVAATAFGARAAQGWLNAARPLRSLREEAQRLGLVLSDEAARNAETVADRIGDLGLAFRVAFSEQLLRDTEALERTFRSMQQSAPVIAEALAPLASQTFEGLALFLQSANWERVANILEGIVNNLNVFASLFGVSLAIRLVRFFGGISQAAVGAAGKIAAAWQSLRTAVVGGTAAIATSADVAGTTATRVTSLTGRLSGLAQLLRISAGGLASIAVVIAGFFLPELIKWIFRQDEATKSVDSGKVSAEDLKVAIDELSESYKNGGEQLNAYGTFMKTFGERLDTIKESAREARTLLEGLAGVYGPSSPFSDPNPLEGRGAGIDSAEAIERDVANFRRAGAQLSNPLIGRQGLAPAAAQAELPNPYGEGFADAIGTASDIDRRAMAVGNVIGAVVEVTDAVADSVNVIEEWKRQFSEFTVDDFVSNLNEAATAIKSGLENSLEDLIFQTTSAGDAFRGFIRIVLQEIVKLVAIQPIVQGLSSSIAGFVGGIGSSTGGAPARNLGGPVSAGTTYLVGETGRELFTPSVSGYITPNYAMTSAGAVNTNVNVYSSDSAAIQKAIADAVPGISASIRAEVQNDLNRRGPFRR